MSFFRTGRPEWIRDLEPNEVFYNDLWNYRTIQLGLIESEPNQFDAGKINTKSINSLNTKLKRIFKHKVWYSKTYINDIGFEIKPAFEMKRQVTLNPTKTKTSPHVLTYKPNLKELNENLITNIGHYLVPSNLLVKNPIKYGVTKQQTDELFGLLKSDYTLVKYEDDERIYNFVNWITTNPFEVKE